MYKFIKQFALVVSLMFSALCFADADVGNTIANDIQVWEQLKQGAEGYTASQSQYHAQAIQPAETVATAEMLIDARLDYLAPALFAALFGMIAVFIVFIKINGISELHHGYSGKMVYRWSKFDVAIHWIGAIPCLLLIVTGLILLGGRLVLPDLMGGAWGGLVSFAKEAHDILAIPFMIGWLLMTVLWAKNQIPAMYDIKWFMVVGGYINFGPFKGQHPDAGFANAGEKLWFWTFAAFGALISATGMVLLFPNLFDITRDLSLLALIVHGVAAIVICAFSIVHIFMATIMSEGGMDCMISGYCDENWATQHHNLWFDEIKENGTLTYLPGTENGNGSSAKAHH